jgi:hypothetical protein
VTYGIKVFDKEVVLFKSFYTKLTVLESFSLLLTIVTSLFRREKKHCLLTNANNKYDVQQKVQEPDSLEANYFR